MGKLKEYIVDRWLTWRTGKTKEERNWHDWYDANVNYGATRIKDMFRNFKHIIIVDTHKFMDPAEPFAWVPCADARQYFWPARPLGENCVWRFERVMNAPSTAWEWHINELGGEDKVFVATNSDTDAMMIALKYAG
jgi:hypothetical protein